MISVEHLLTQAVRPSEQIGADEEGDVGLGVSPMEMDDNYGVVIFLEANDEEDDWDGDVDSICFLPFAIPK